MNQFNWTEESEKQWNQSADHWSSRSKKMWETGSRKDIIPFLAQYVPVNSVICDLGCGDGYGSRKLTLAGYSVTGVDVSDDMLHKAYTLNSDNNARFEKADIGHLPFSDGSFDALMAINSLEWTESPLQVLDEMNRVLKRDGKACVAILGPTAGPRTNSFPRLYGKKSICNTMMPWEFERLLKENGWQKLDEFGVYKQDSIGVSMEKLPLNLKQALSFFWVFMLKKSR
ncbi:class I SAM-dependent methyltransferase [Cytobacillus sp. Hz8]|uniref:class I SAM-dependent methyltransferase n=1 Tax=Cytobacillus sp. Hz8 TaxID=3347168 RepID=UPI0035DAA90C